MGQVAHHTAEPLSAGPNPGGRGLRILIAGGGTGGHLFPAIAIAREFERVDADNRICFVSAGNPFEKSTLAREGYRLVGITTEGIKGRGLSRQTRAAAKIPLGVFEAMRIVKRFKPDLVFGVGSYAAGPVVLGAWLMGIRIVLHEQNMLPGVTNRVLSRFADRIYVSFEPTRKRLAPGKTHLTGNPVRREILKGQMDSRRIADPHGPHSRFVVLIVGGSQGAHAINMAVIDALDRLGDKTRYFFIHQTGSPDWPLVAAAYRKSGVNGRVQPFFNDMGECYRMADLVVCRAGATTVAEVTALGKAVVFIPYPHAADDHQMLNARLLSDRRAAETLTEDTLSGERLCRSIEAYAGNPDKRLKMETRARAFGRPEAAAEIVRDCYRLLDAAYPERVRSTTGRPRRSALNRNGNR